MDFYLRQDFIIMIIDWPFQPIRNYIFENQTETEWSTNQNWHQTRFKLHFNIFHWYICYYCLPFIKSQRQASARMVFQTGALNSPSDWQIFINLDPIGEAHHLTSINLKTWLGWTSWHFFFTSFISSLDWLS